MKEKRDVTIGIHFQVSKQFLSDILVGMAETCPEMLVWFGDDTVQIVRIEDTDEPRDWLKPLSVVRIDGKYDAPRGREGNRRRRATLDFPKVVEGLMLVPHANVNSEIKGRIMQAMAENDCGQIDSEAADVIAQLALYGKVVYG